jgi:hypothetical protein
MALFLLAPPAFAHTRVLSVTVSPEHATVGEQTCFHFQLVGQAGKPVRGAEVVLEGKAARSNHQGRARICTRIEWAGRHFALAVKRHYRMSSAMIQASSHGLQSGAGSWMYVQYHLAAYGSDGNCGDWTFGDGQYGLCDGNVTSNDPYPNTLGSTDWRPRNGTVFLNFYTRINKDAHYGFSDFEGFAPNAGSGDFYVEQAYIDLNIGFRGGSDGCPKDANYGCLVSGTDPTKTGKPGGPLSLDVEYHHPFLSVPGYTFDISGYVRSRCPC